MIPTVPDDLKQDFVFGIQPSRTFHLRPESMTIHGIVDQVQAVAQAVYLILNTERYTWLIHSWNYGVELHNLIGKPIDFAIPEIERRVKEALLQDDRITAVDKFDFQVSKRTVLATFRVVSTFGNFEVSKEVNI